MSQLRKRVENIKPAILNLPSDADGDEPTKLWPATQAAIVGIIDSLADNADLADTLKADPEILQDNGRMIRLIIKVAREEIERVIVLSLREPDVEEAMKDIREIPFGDFNALAATLFAITFPGGITGFLSLWTRVTGLTLTSSTLISSTSRSATPKEPETDSADTTNQIPIEDRPTLTEDELPSEMR